MAPGALRSMVDGFFLVNPDRDYFVFVDGSPEPGVDTFVCISRDLHIVAFNRTAPSQIVSAEVLAHWFCETDEGQETIEKMILGLDEEKRVGAEIQARGDLVLMPTHPTAH